MQVESHGSSHKSERHSSDDNDTNHIDLGLKTPKHTLRSDLDKHSVTEPSGPHTLHAALVRHGHKGGDGNSFSLSVDDDSSDDSKNSGEEYVYTYMHMYACMYVCMYVCIQGW